MKQRKQVGMNVFTETLLEWYKLHKRELPWRDIDDPYRIWVSEIILQQTRVAQGYDYYLRFVNRFPDVKTLAEAPEDEVLKYWAGLGYYSRARNLHAAAQDMKGEFPRTYNGVRTLKGVGDYTAAAICSMAYEMPYAVVDGNVYRVLSRYFGIDTPIDTTEGKKLFAALAQEMLPASRPSAYNQAIMDFGATCCTSQSPACQECPLADGCVALREGRVPQLPVKARKTKVTHLYYHYLFIRSGQYTYIYKRNKPGIWRHLFEFPLIESDAPMELGGLLKHAAFRSFVPENVEPEVQMLCRDVLHQLSHRTIHASLYALFLPSDVQLPPPLIRVEVGALTGYAMSSLMKGFVQKYASVNKKTTANLA